MIKSMTKKMNNKKGFTLIELIVVIAILGILAAIAIPRLTGFQADAKKKADTATFEMVDKAVAILVADGTVKSDGTVTATPDATTGAITIGGTAKGGASNSTADLQAAITAQIGVAKLQDTDNITAGAKTWTIDISAGTIASPTY